MEKRKIITLALTLASAGSLLIYGVRSISKPVKTDNRAQESVAPTLISCSQMEWVCKIKGSANDNPDTPYNKLKLALENKQFSYKLIITKPSGEVNGDLNTPEVKFKVKNNEEFRCHIIIYDHLGNRLDCDSLSGIQKCLLKSLQLTPTVTLTPIPSLIPTNTPQIIDLSPTVIIPTSITAPPNANINATTADTCRRGDFNNDGATNARDYAQLLTHMGGTDSAFDLDGDTAVTTLDLVRLMNNCFLTR